MESQFSIQSLVENILIIIGLLFISWLAKKMGLQIRNQHTQIAQTITQMQNKVNIIASSSNSGSQNQSKDNISPAAALPEKKEDDNQV